MYQLGPWQISSELVGGQVDKNSFQTFYHGEGTSQKCTSFRSHFFISAVFLEVSKIDSDVGVQLLLPIKIFIEVLLLLHILPSQSFLDPPYKGGCPVFVQEARTWRRRPLSCLLCILPVAPGSHPIQLFSWLPVGWFHRGHRGDETAPGVTLCIQIQTLISSHPCSPVIAFNLLTATRRGLWLGEPLIRDQLPVLEAVVGGGGPERERETFSGGLQRPAAPHMCPQEPHRSPRTPGTQFLWWVLLQQIRRHVPRLLAPDCCAAKAVMQGS